MGHDEMGDRIHEIRVLAIIGILNGASGIFNSLQAAIIGDGLFFVSAVFSLFAVFCCIVFILISPAKKEVVPCLIKKMGSLRRMLSNTDLQELILAISAASIGFIALLLGIIGVYPLIVAITSIILAGSVLLWMWTEDFRILLPIIIVVAGIWAFPTIILFLGSLG